MKSIEHIGLSNVVPDTATIVHSTVFGRNTHGRVADLLCAWLENESGFDATATGPLRILIAALLEVFPKKSSSFSRIEMCASGGWIHLAVRAECGIEIVPEEVERSFTQFWLNHPGIQLLKKCLFPSDHIEVRYQKTSGLMEWRVGRPAGGAEDAHESSGFLV
ncbi:MAG: hypothetical protein EBX52_13170, partial [Proteobacteria bacterium]|nr:hypothetical protein [Pseudomonadota bacterium]